MSKPASIHARHLTTPREHLGVLIQPPITTANLAALRRDFVLTPSATADARVLGKPVGGFRIGLTEQYGLVPSQSAVDDGGSPFVVAGHQAEFFHAGIFAKTIAADLLAERTNGQAVFLLVDSDTPKASHVRIPMTHGGQLEYSNIPIPGIDRNRVVEFQPPSPVSEWRAFFEKLASGTPDSSLLGAFAEGALAGSGAHLQLTDLVARGQAGVERALGLRPAQTIRMSDLANTLSFRVFLAHWLVNAPAMAGFYNLALSDYRQRHGLRGSYRPVPPLLIGERIECPFWVYRAGEPRRRLFAQLLHERVILFADDQEIAQELLSRFTNLDYHGTPWELSVHGWRFRPRALMLSAFARLFLADVFLHGIGGARYDEVTEDFVRRAFGIDLPPLACVSATLHLAIPGAQHVSGDPSLPRVTPRDLLYNPQRVLSELPADLVVRRNALVAESTRLRGSDDKKTRRMTYESIRGVNQSLREAAAAQTSEIERNWSAIAQRHKRDAILHDREYFFALHAREDLAALVQRIRETLD